MYRLRATVLALVCVPLFGCGESVPPGVVEPQSSTVTESTSSDTAAVPTESPAAPQKKRTFAPVTLGGDKQVAANSGTDVSPSDARRVDRVIEQLKPLQVLLGAWRGTTRREFEGFKAVDEHEWVWDLRTDAQQPALVMSSGGKSPYVKEARLTWLVESDKYTLTITSPEDESRVFVGAFKKPIADVAGDDGKLQRTFALTFTQTEPAGAKEQFQYTFNQQENNRYLLEIEKKRGKAKFRRFDTVSTQRDGTSFALSDSDYGDKTCIISAGLGTMQVSYKGRTYWVCCSGCKAAFEEDPERWIRRAADDVE